MSEYLRGRGSEEVNAIIWYMHDSRKIGPDAVLYLGYKQRMILALIELNDVSIERTVDGTPWKFLKVPVVWVNAEDYCKIEGPDLGQAAEIERWKERYTREQRHNAQLHEELAKAKKERDEAFLSAVMEGML